MVGIFYDVTTHNSGMACSFALEHDEELEQFVEQNKAQNTVRKTKSDINVWNKWCATNGEVRSMEDIPTSELNSLLGQLPQR